MAEFAAFDIVGRCAQLAGFGLDLVRRNKNEFGLRVDEFPDEPRARHTVNFHFLTGNPFHTFHSD
jgi:hypothetical protein